jgi:hypothetical protein
MSDGNTKELPRTRYGDTEAMPFVPMEEVGDNKLSPEERRNAIVGFVCLFVGFILPYVMMCIFGGAGLPGSDRVWVDGHYEAVMPLD